MEVSRSNYIPPYDEVGDVTAFKTVRVLFSMNFPTIQFNTLFPLRIIPYSFFHISLENVANLIFRASVC
jgi:hypothetical protein